MLGALFQWLICMTSGTTSEKSLFTVFVMVLSWRWLLRKFTLATIFGFFLVEL